MGTARCGLRVRLGVRTGRRRSVACWVPASLGVKPERAADSFTKDITKPDVERSREIVVRNAEELTDARRIRTVLAREKLFSQQLLESYILEALINRPE